MPRQASIAIVIPALNEELVIGAVVRSIQAALPPRTDARVIVVDNGSGDLTREAAAAAGAEVVTEPVRGYGRACRAGVEAASGSDIVVFLDGDGADDPTDLPSILAPLRHGEADLVVGVRSRAQPGSLSPQQVWGNRLAAAAIRLLTGVGARDLGPFRAIARSRLLALQMEEMTYGWSTEMLLKSLRAGLRYREVEVNYRRRAGGVSKVGGSASGSLRAGWSILSTVARHSSWLPPAEATRRTVP